MGRGLSGAGHLQCDPTFGKIEKRGTSLDAAEQASTLLAYVFYFSYNPLQTT